MSNKDLFTGTTGPEGATGPTGYSSSTETVRPLEGGELAIWNIIRLVFWVCVLVGFFAVMQALLFSNPLATIVVLLVLILLNQGTRGL